MTLGEKIAYLRLKDHLTQNELAKMIFVSRNAISKWETDNGYPNIDNIKLLAETFKVSIDELVNKENLKQIEDENNKKYMMYSSMVLLFYFIINGVLVSINESSFFNANDLSHAIFLMFLQFFFIGILVFFEIYLNKKFQSRKQRKLNKTIWAIIGLCILVVLLVSVITVLTFDI